MLKESAILPYFLFCALLSAAQQPTPRPFVLRPDNYRHYIDSFNANDEELFVQYISNNKSWPFLSKNIPLLDCPDKLIEQTYYFRWWTYRKHIKQTPHGFIITEFLPDVPWAGKYNAISCPAALHISEGRWLRDQQYINDYEKFWLTEGKPGIRTYSFWIADAVFKQYEVTHNDSLAKALLPALIENYEAWEKNNLDPNGLFWQVDGKDGMEVSICGANTPHHAGYRATINSYMYGDATAIAKIAELAGEREIVDRFKKKAATIKQNVEGQLWDESAAFFKVRLRDSLQQLCSARELHGYTPWYFNMPGEKYAIAWKYLMDPKYFYAPYGPTTAEQNHPGFSISYAGHECQWNGPSWPLATSITLTGLANLLNNYRQDYITRKDYYQLVSIYTNSQQRKREDGKTVPWIDENLNPFTGDWISRTRLKTWSNGTWSKEKGGKERGKDYNHSTYCDLIITGLIGLRPQEGNSLVVNPLLPDDAWDYFCLDNVPYHGKNITVLYDKTGNRYRKGKGFIIFINGEKAAASPVLKELEVKL